ncbi:LysR family transcriptional regulator [Burkholderia pyrrocinia]|uniref:LysR family transcriptional regulator n=1 Tax=Burkholderia pyrrocinia TaxID=60550 RepID=UPI001BCB0810|nr:LysR family transcriptional regulator [Burkholderia pyrrocinia]QVN22907.1 LysR family transcriptional regulator [Burkholderia pyrrocinia]
MDTKLLQDFLALAATGNFTRAAELRHVSQAAFSRRIQALESWAGVPLVERGSIPSRLTEAGQRLRVTAAETVAKLSRAKADLSGAAPRQQEHIRVGISSSLATLFLPQWWSAWTRDIQLTAEVMVGDIYDLVTALASNHVDILITYECNELPLPFSPERYESKWIRGDCLKPFASRQWIQEKGVVWPGTAAAPIPLLMWTRGHYMDRLVERVIEKAPFPLIGTRVFENRSLEVLHAMTSHGHGVAWMLETLVLAAGNDCVSLGGAAWSLPMSVRAFREIENANPALECLWQMLPHST